jgi:predicted metalloendopeptidase
MQKLEIGADIAKVIQINPIYFDLAKWNIRADAAKELDKIVKVMQENPTMTIELGSHTDCRSSKAYNLSLSASVLNHQQPTSYQRASLKTESLVKVMAKANSSMVVNAKVKSYHLALKKNIKRIVEQSS